MDEERDDGKSSTEAPKKKRKPKQKRFRYHNFMLVQQPQYLHPPYDTLEKLLERVEKIGAESYAGILHDKDSGEKDHLHIFVHFKNAREISALARHWGIAPERVQKWDDGVENGYAYLTHRTPKAKADYQYDPKEVVANFDYVNWLQQYEAKKVDSQKVSMGNSSELDIKFLLDCLYVGAATREEVEERLSGSQYAKYHRQIDDVWAKRLQNLAEQRVKERKAKGQKIEVIWIFGAAGTGKTRFAKEQAAKREEHYFITGSSRDPFQRYSGQDVIIYDEARPNDIPFSDLLKLLDPYGEDVSAPSRYYDKAICAASYFITSPYSPLAFYQKIMGENWAEQSDGFDQLLRRLSLVIQMTRREILAVRYDFNNREFLPIEGTRRHNSYRKEIEKLTMDTVGLFNSFFEEGEMENE